MIKTWVLTSDGLEAHLLKLIDSDDPLTGPHLAEETKFANHRLKELRDEQLAREKSGQTWKADRVDNSAHERSSTHADFFQDYADQAVHLFAKKVVHEAVRRMQHATQPGGRLALIMGPQMLGAFRTALGNERLPSDMKVFEVCKNLKHRSLKDMHDVLAQEGIVRARMSPRRTVRQGQATREQPDLR